MFHARQLYESILSATHIGLMVCSPEERVKHTAFVHDLAQQLSADPQRNIDADDLQALATQSVPLSGEEIRRVVRQIIEPSVLSDEVLRSILSGIRYDADRFELPKILYDALRRNCVLHDAAQAVADGIFEAQAYLQENFATQNLSLTAAGADTAKRELKQYLLVLEARRDAALHEENQKQFTAYRAANPPATGITVIHAHDGKVLHDPRRTTEAAE